MTPPTVPIHCDTRPLRAALADLLEQAPKVRLEVGQRVLGALEPGAQLVRLDCDRTVAGGAGDCRVVLQPSELLLELLGAVRAAT